MYREMRRKKQFLSENETIKIFEKGTSGTLALIGDGDYPYALPISYVYCDKKLFFHSAKEGHKIDAMKKNNKVSFCVIDKDDVVPEKYTTYFRSAIAFGRIKILEDVKQKHKAMEKFIEKYSPENPERRQREIELHDSAFCVMELEIEHMTGKESIHLVKNGK